MYPADFGNSTYFESVDPCRVRCGRDAGDTALAPALSRHVQRGVQARRARRRLPAHRGERPPWWYVEFAGQCGVNVCAMSMLDAWERCRRPSLPRRKILRVPYYDYFACASCTREASSPPRNGHGRGSGLRSRCYGGAIRFRRSARHRRSSNGARRPTSVAPADGLGRRSSRPRAKRLARVGEVRGRGARRKRLQSPGLPRCAVHRGWRKFPILGVMRGEEIVCGVALYERTSRGGAFVSPRLLLYYNGVVVRRYETHIRRRRRRAT